MNACPERLTMERMQIRAEGSQVVLFRYQRNGGTNKATRPETFWPLDLHSNTFLALH